MTSTDWMSMVHSVTGYQPAKSPKPAVDPAQVTKDVPVNNGQSLTTGQSPSTDRRVSIADQPSVPAQDSYSGSSSTNIQGFSSHAGSRFSRPQSSGGSLAAGFSYAKPKPVAMNMTRKLGSATAISTRSSSQHNMPVNKEVVVSDALEARGANSNGPSTVVELHHSGSGSPGHEQDSDHQAQIQEAEKDLEESMQADRSASVPATNEVVMKGFENKGTTLGEVPRRAESEKDADEELTLVENPPREKRTQEICRPIRPSKPLTPTKPRQTPLNVKDKVSKPRRKLFRRPMGKLADPEDLDDGEPSLTLTNEEKLAVWKLRYKKQEQLREKERAAHATELQDLKEISSGFWVQLQEAIAREKLQNEELSRRKANHPKLAEKLKGLTKYVDGLNRDHHALRDKARSIQDEQAALRQEKARLFSDVDQIRQSQEASVASCRSILNEAKQDLQLQHQTIATLQTKLRDDASSLSAERSRNDLILTEIVKLGASQQNFAQASAAQGVTFVSKLNMLLGRLEDLEAYGQSKSFFEELKLIMCQCKADIDMLQQSEKVKVDDFRGLDTLVRNSTVELSNEVKAYHHDVQEHKFDAQAFVSQIEPTIVTLNDSIKTERALRDEITEHCTKNASLENKVSIAQSELHDAREKLAAAARDNEEALKQKITSLDETIRDHSKASQETLDHVLSLEEQHNTLQETLQQLQDASTRESEILQRKLEDFSGAQLRSEEANRELAQVRAKVISLEERHSATIERLNKEHQREQDDYHVKVELDRNLTAEEHRLNVERLEGQIEKLLSQTLQKEEEAEELGEKLRNNVELVERKDLELTDLQSDRKAADDLAQERTKFLNRATAQKAVFKAAVAALAKQREQCLASLNKANSEKESFKASSGRFELEKDKEHSSLLSVQETLKKCEKELEDTKANVERLQSEKIQSVADAREADAALQESKQRLAVEIQQGNELRRDLERLKDKFAAGAGKTCTELSHDHEGSSSPVPRRKADRAGNEVTIQVVEDSQSQQKRIINEETDTTLKDSRSQTEPEMATQNSQPPTTTPTRAPPNFAPDQTYDNTYESPAILADFFPTTLSARKPPKLTVKFVEDSMTTTNRQISYTDHLSLDYSDIDLEFQQASRSLTESPTRHPRCSQATTISPHRLNVQDRLRDKRGSPPSHTVLPAKGILKTSRTTKRDADVAGLDSQSGRAKKTGSAQKSLALGPIIPDSQSQARSQGARNPCLSLSSSQNQSRSHSQPRYESSGSRYGASGVRGSRSRRATSRGQGSRKPDRLTQYFSEQKEKAAE